MKRSISLIVAFSFIGLSLGGCASMGRSLKELVGGKTTKKKVKRKQTTVGKIDKKKNYRRMDHKTLQEESQLGPSAGSLWIERGQGSYLFTQNTNRLIGDLVNVEIEGQAKKQIETKVKVIQDLINKIKAQQEARKLAAQQRKAPKTSKGKKSKGAGPPAPAPAAPKKADQKFDVKIVPSRITDILKDGSYMVKGDQTFMIGKREYKLVVDGIVRQEDFDDQGISAETLLDPKFDIVTNRKKR